MNSFDELKEEIQQELKVYEQRYEKVLLSHSQINLLVSVIDFWYLAWKQQMLTSPFGRAKEHLKELLEALGEKQTPSE